MTYLVKSTKIEKEEQYRLWGGIKMKTVIVVPNNRLYSQREWTEMALMCYGGNKLQKKKNLIQLALWASISHSLLLTRVRCSAITSVFNNFKVENETKKLN